MNHTTLALLIFSVLCSVESNAQEIIHTRKLAKLADTAFRNLDELNALVFEPDGYERVMHPKLPDSLSSMSMLSKEERAELREKRERFNPYLTFDQTIELRKRNIFIGFSAAFIRLSSYFKYNNDTLSEEEFRKKVNRNLTGKNMIGYSQDFELLEDVKDPFRRLINADTAFIYDSKFTYNFKDTVDNYGCLVVHLVKFDLGYVGLRYYYPLDERKIALSEINDTWGILQFKPDREFSHPNHEGRIPISKEPDLYFGKFSFLNNPEQVSRERKQYEYRKLKGKANSLAREAVRLAQSKKYDQAKEKLAEVLTVDSANAIAYRYLLLISLDENNKEKSWSYWNKLAAIDPEDKETWFLKGVTEKRYNELDSAGKTFEWIVREKDSLHFRSLIELASISILKGDNKAADLNFNRAINIFKTEGEKSIRRETHRILNINDLFKVRMAYARFLNANSEFDKSKRLLKQTLNDEKLATEARKKGERPRIYGMLTKENLAELHYMLSLP